MLIVSVFVFVLFHNACQAVGRVAWSD